MKKHYVVSAAVITHGPKILCVQRNKSKYDYISYKYEFPGGKLEEGESGEEAIVREIKEELNLDISVSTQYLTVEHEYPDFSLTMHSFLCTTDNPHPELREHVDAKWLERTELEQLDWAAADIPIVEKLISTNAL